jgi:hypothetical protein
LADAGETIPTMRRMRATKAVVTFFMLPPRDLSCLSVKEALLLYRLI